jgi:hypothetical protein
MGVVAVYVYVDQIAVKVNPYIVVAVGDIGYELGGLSLGVHSGVPSLGGFLLAPGRFYSVTPRVSNERHGYRPFKR